VFEAVRHAIDYFHQVFEGTHLPLGGVCGILAFYFAQYPLGCGHFAYPTWIRGLRGDGKRESY
jgi:hypothetical protein